MEEHSARNRDLTRVVDEMLPSLSNVRAALSVASVLSGVGPQEDV